MQYNVDGLVGTYHRSCVNPPEMTEMGRSIRFFGYDFLTNAADASTPRDWGQYFSSITGEGKH
jgi:hypothetical protein